jgi:hypothetical protein
MAYNKETHKKESVILPIDIALLAKADSRKERRSMSGQLSYIVEQYYAQQRRIANELESKNT